MHFLQTNIGEAGSPLFYLQFMPSSCDFSFELHQSRISTFLRDNDYRNHMRTY